MPAKTMKNAAPARARVDVARTAGPARATRAAVRRRGAGRRRDAARRRERRPPRRAASPRPRRARSRRAMPDALVIGSDQVADADGVAIGKPGDHAAAVAQLTRAVRARDRVSHRGRARRRGERPRANCASSTCATHVSRVDRRRRSSTTCAASGRTIAPASSSRKRSASRSSNRIDSDDPTALIGLPLIASSTCCARKASTCSTRTASTHRCVAPRYRDGQRDDARWRARCTSFRICSAPSRPTPVLPARTIDIARRSSHWIVETPKAARAFLKSLAVRASDRRAVDIARWPTSDRGRHSIRALAAACRRPRRRPAVRRRLSRASPIRVLRSSRPRTRAACASCRWSARRPSCSR